MSPIAVTKYGKVSGVVTTSALDTEYISFYGIPYGAPPIGELRFKVSLTLDLIHKLHSTHSIDMRRAVCLSKVLTCVLF